MSHFFSTKNCATQNLLAHCSHCTLSNVLNSTSYIACICNLLDLRVEQVALAGAPALTHCSDGAVPNLMT